jgi:Glycosyl hydrolase family 26
VAPPCPAGVYRGPCGVWAQNGVVTSAQAGITAYAAWLGQPVTYVLDYITDTPTSWVGQFEGAYVVAPSGPVTGFTALSSWGSLGARTMCLAVPACAGKSVGSGASTWAGEAAGTNDAYWTALGNNLVTWGYGSAVLRIGREWNGNWYNWCPAVTGDSPASYIAGYQHIVTTLKAVAGNSFKFMWNPIIGAVDGQAAGTVNRDAQQWYPGNAYTDSIGLDVYDWGYYSTQTAAPFGYRTLAQQ